MGVQVKVRQAEAIMRHQEKEARLRTALTEDQAEYLRNQVQRQFPEAELGRYVYHPASVPGSRRYYQQKYTNLLALTAELGRNPDWFLTVTLDLNHAGRLPILRDQLTVPGGNLFKHFQLHSQGYNLFNKMARHGCSTDFVTGGGPTVGIMNAEVNFTLSDVVPSNPDRPPTLGNWMAMDPARAMESMQSDPRYRDTFADLRTDVLEALNAELRRVNPLARTYATAGELLREYRERHNNELPRYRIIFMKKQRGALLDENGNPLRNAIDIPMAGGQQVLIWHDATGDSAAPDYRGTWLRHQGIFVEMGKWDPFALAAAFPIIFGTAEPWFVSGMRTAAVVRSRTPMMMPTQLQAATSTSRKRSSMMV